MLWRFPLNYQLLGSMFFVKLKGIERKFSHNPNSLSHLISLATRVNFEDFLFVILRSWLWIQNSYLFCKCLVTQVVKMFEISLSNIPGKKKKKKS